MSSTITSVYSTPLSSFLYDMPIGVGIADIVEV
jgi:hypothetical protein